jgi:guanylate kinase
MKIIGIIGPCGCGKSALVHELKARGVVSVTPTFTDRPKRPDEQSIEHAFVSPHKFDELIGQGKFLEVVKPFGLDYRYGLPEPKPVYGTHPLVMTRAVFIGLFREHFPDNVIYQIETSKSEAELRLRSRGDKELGTRLSNFDNELQQGRQLSDRIFVNDHTIGMLASMVEAAIGDAFSST